MAGAEPGELDFVGVDSHRYEAHEIVFSCRIPPDPGLKVTCGCPMLQTGRFCAQFNDLRERSLGRTDNSAEYGGSMHGSAREFGGY